MACFTGGQAQGSWDITMGCCLRQYFFLDTVPDVFFVATPQRCCEYSLISVSCQSEDYMVTNRIEELEGEKATLDREYGQKLKEYKEMEKQMSVMKQYME